VHFVETGGEKGRLKKITSVGKKKGTEGPLECLNDMWGEFTYGEARRRNDTPRKGRGEKGPGP